MARTPKLKQLYYQATARVGDFAGRCACASPMVYRMIPTEPLHEGSDLGPAVVECTACDVVLDAWPVKMKEAADEAVDPIGPASPPADDIAKAINTPNPTTPPRTPRMAPKPKPANTPVPYVQHVTATLKRGTFTHELGPKTLILGANGKGKTSIVQAITLALLGLALDVGGKDAETQDAAIWRHLSHSDQDVVSDVKMSDGRAFNYLKHEGKESEGTHLPKAAHAAALPLLTLKDLLAGSAPTVRKWALSVADRWVTLDTLRATIASHNAQGVLAVKKDAEGSATDWLEAERKKAEQHKKSAQDAVRAAERSLLELGASAGMPVGDEAVAAAAAAVTNAAVVAANGITAAAKEHAVGVLAGCVANLDTANAQLAQAQQAVAAAHAAHGVADASAKEAQGYVAHLQAAIDGYAKPATMDDATRNTLAGLLAFLPPHRASFTGDCGLCGAHQGDGTAYLARVDAMIAQVDAVLNPPDPAAEIRGNFHAWAAEHARRAQLVHDAAMAYHAADAQVKAASTAIDRAQSQIDAATVEANKPVLPDDAAAAQQAQAVYADLLKRQGLHAQIAQTRLGAAASKEIEGTCNQILDAIKAVSETLTANALGLLEAEVSKFLPDGETFKLELAASYVRVGFVKNGIFRSAMSGAEEARVYAAIACALAGPDVAIVIPAERQWSPSTLRDVMRALADAPCQVILISTAKPEGKIALKTWTVIDLGDAEDVENTKVLPHTKEPSWIPAAGGEDVDHARANNYSTGDAVDSYTGDGGLATYYRWADGVVTLSHPESDTYKLWPPTKPSEAAVLPAPAVSLPVNPAIAPPPTVAVTPVAVVLPPPVVVAAPPMPSVAVAPPVAPPAVALPGVPVAAAAAAPPAPPMIAPPPAVPRPPGVTPMWMPTLPPDFEDLDGAHPPDFDVFTHQQFAEYWQGAQANCTRYHDGWIIRKSLVGSCKLSAWRPKAGV